MAISFVGADVLEVASAAIPTYQAGDLLIVAGWRSGSFLADPSGWTLVVGATASNYYASAWSKVAASGSSSDVVTLTGASYIGVWMGRWRWRRFRWICRSEEHTSELQSH